LETHKHQGVSRESHQMIIKGTGRATSKAWGGSKDAVHRSLNKYKNKKLHVNLTEKVGNNTWYRGKINGSGQNVWLHENQVKQIEITESETSRLGHIRGGDDRKIYKTLGGKSTQPSSKHWNKVYYIKRQAKMDSETYYLLSRSPSASKNVVGWMNAKDLETHKHPGGSRESHQMIIKGTGRATSKAWGGSKDAVHRSLNKYKNKKLHVNLTEKVGNNTWYRGKINGSGQNVWLHENQVKQIEISESETSRLGHIRGGDDRKIYKTLGGKSTQPSSKHWNKVYYIKRQAKMDSETYYLLSRSPSASKNVVGWMNAKDLETHKHQGVSRESHQMIIKGTGRATSKAWGGSKDTVHQSMKSFTGDIFDINLTEK